MPALAYRAKLPRPNDPDIYNRVADAIRAGHALPSASTHAGISEATGRDWLAIGSQQLDEGNEQGSHVAFARAVKQAEADLIDRKLGKLAEASDRGVWQSDAWMLERRFPQHYGQRNRLDVEQRSVSVSINVTLDQLPAGAIPALMDALQELAPTPAPLQLETGGVSETDPTG